MAKIFTLAPREDWIVDRMVDEWNQGNPDLATTNIYEADVVWLMADWAWDAVPLPLLQQKKVLTTVHHIVPEKFGPSERLMFNYRDQITDAYHVFNERVRDFIRPLTSKPIHLVRYWANGSQWHRVGDRVSLAQKWRLPKDKFLVGSAQRDTEGAGLPKIVKPKLEKGPDLFVQACKDWRTQGKDVHVVLAGWRRDYVVQELTRANIPYSLIERPPLEVVRELYSLVDVYAVTSRCEGGPQALIEAGLTGTPVVSTPVGIAEQVLPSTAIHADVTQATPAVPDVSSMLLPAAFQAYRDLLLSL